MAMSAEDIPTEGPRIPAWTVGDRMAKARESAGKTQAQMGEHFGVKAETISTWENMTRQPKQFNDKLRQWAEVTNVSYTWLVTGSGGGVSMVTKDDALRLVHSAPTLPGISAPSRIQPELSSVN